MFAADAPAVMTKAIADAIRVTPAEARRRLRDAEQLAARTALSGESLPAVRRATAAVWNTGMLDVEHLRVIQKFLRDLPTLILHAKDRGCTHPGCDMPGYLCEVHHITDWAHDGPTDIENLTFACGQHHKLLDKGWRTTTLTNARTQWMPPPQLELPSTTDDFHHPERFLTEWGDDPAP